MTPNDGSRRTAGLVLLCASFGSLAAAQEGGGRIEVRVDARVELMSIIFRLAGNPEYNQAADYTYARDVDRHFRLFKNHPAVLAAARLRNVHSVSYDAVMSMAIHVEDTTGLAERVPLHRPPERLDRRWPAEEARAFLERVRAFVKDSGFEKFVEDHRPLYDLAALRLRQRLDQRNYISWFNTFFGARPTAKFIAIPGLLNGGQAYGPSVRFPDGSDELYMILGVSKTDLLGGPVFDEQIVPTVVHEFCHSYVNAVVDRFADQIKPAGRKIFPHVDAQMRTQAYGNWLTVMRESCVRACVVRYVLAMDGSDAGRREIDAQHRRGFAWTGELVELLAGYEADRTRYPTFEAFFPHIVQFFDRYAEGNLDVLLAAGLGPINNVFGEYRSGERMIFVTPDGIADAAQAKRLLSFLDGIHKQFFADSGVKKMPAGRLSDAQLRDHAFVVYGSPASNALVRKIAEAHEVRLAPEFVSIGDKRFDGRHLVLIACLPSPYNKNLPALIYASHDDQYLFNANAFFHGPTDYVVGRWAAGGRAVVVHSGHFERASDGSLAAQ